MKDKIKRFFLMLFAFLLFPVIVYIFVGCSISKPNLKDDYVGLLEIEKTLQYRFDRCCYMQQYVKKDLRCTDLLLENRKITNIIDYKKMEKEKQLPKLFNKNGEYDMTFDDFYKYVK